MVDWPGFAGVAVDRLSNAPQTEAPSTAVRSNLEMLVHLLFAFAPFLTFCLITWHLFQVGEVIPHEHKHD